LMPIKRFAGALAPVPHLRIVDTSETVFFCAFLYLTSATGFLFHILADQSLQQSRVGLDRFGVFGMLLSSLLGQAQQSSPILDDLRQQLLPLGFVIPVDGRFSFQAAAKIPVQLLLVRPTADRFTGHRRQPARQFFDSVGQQIVGVLHRSFAQGRRRVQSHSNLTTRHSRRVAPHRWTSSAALRPARAAPVGPETPAAHSSVSALLPSPSPTLPSTAGRILSARWPLQNSHPRMPAKTRC